MPDPTPKEAAGRLQAAVDTARWAGLTDEEIKAIVVARLLTK